MGKFFLNCCNSSRDNFLGILASLIILLDINTLKINTVYRIPYKYKNRVYVVCMYKRNSNDLFLIICVWFSDRKLLENSCFLVYIYYIFELFIFYTYIYKSAYFHIKIKLIDKSFFLIIDYSIIQLFDNYARKKVYSINQLLDKDRLLNKAFHICK